MWGLGNHSKNFMKGYPPKPYEATRKWGALEHENLSDCEKPTPLRLRYSRPLTLTQGIALDSKHRRPRRTTRIGANT
jgi:hypothetical protein